MKLAALALFAACHHADAPPPDYPPLPPMSSTAVGLLIDQATALELSTAQLETLEQIDHELHAKNDVIDGDLDTIERPGRPIAEPERPQDGGGRRGGGHAQEKANEHDAIERAMSELDADQQAKAHALLAQHGFEHAN